MKVIRHRNYVAAESLLSDALANHRPGRLIAVGGIAGAGKTTLVNAGIRSEVGMPHLWGTGKLAVTQVMALQDLNSRFSSKGFAARAHRSLLRPHLWPLFRDAEDAILPEYRESLRKAKKAWPLTSYGTSLTETNHWENFVDCAIDRELRYFVVEHAASIAVVRKDESESDHIQNLMSVLEAVGAMGVLKVVPSGARLWEGRPEIRDRMDIIFIEPYALEVREDLNEFAAIVMELAAEFEFEDAWVYQDKILDIGFATGTSIRAINTLFRSAAASARNAGREKISTQDIALAIPTAAHVEKIWASVKLLDQARASASSDELRRLHANYLNNKLQH